MFIYYILPFLSIVASLFMLYSTQYINRTIGCFFVFICSVFVGFRFYCDPDYAEYVYFIDLASGISLANYIDNIFVEPVFYLAAKVFGFNLFPVYAFASFCFMYFSMCLLEKRFPEQTFFLCLSSLLYVVFFIQLRWGLSLSLFFIGTSFCKDKGPLRAAFFFVAILNHFFSIVIISISYIARYVSYKWIFILICIIAPLTYFASITNAIIKVILIVPFLPDYMKYKIEAYQYIFSEKEMFFYFYLVKYIVFGVVFFKIKNSETYLCNLYSLSLLLFVVFIDVGVFAQRTLCVTEVLFSLLFVKVIYRRCCVDFSMLIYNFLFVSFLTLNWFFNLFMLMKKGYLLPYEQVVF